MGIRDFFQIDVFSSRSFYGNPVAVVPDSKGLTEEKMQQCALWTNLSETVFVFPPTVDNADYLLRIFTPHRELPFAGHPTLGAAQAWLDYGGVPHTYGEIVQECAAGLITVRQSAQGLAFAAPPTVRSGPLDPDYLEKIAQCLHVPVHTIIAHQWVDNGPGWAVVQLASAAEVLSLAPEWSALPDAKVGVIGAYPEGSPHAFETRGFAPGMGITEDPVTGSLNAGIAQWLLREKLIQAPFSLSQGTRLGREGVILISVDPDGTVWVGGQCSTQIRGIINL